MRGLDSNVLVRLLVADDVQQLQRAQAYVQANAPCWINRVVLCEVVWVLRRRYGQSRQRIAAALQTLTEAVEFEIEDAEAVRQGIEALEAGHDFADAVIASTNRRRGCDTTATFDRKAGRLDGFEAL